MTLIEVVAGLALMASLVTALIWAKSQAARRYSVAEAKIRAIAAADSLLATWYQSPRTFPRAGEGRVPASQSDPTSPPLRWRTVTLPTTEVERFGAQVVRLEISQDSSVKPDLRARPGDEILIAVEVVIPGEGIERDK